MNGSEKSKALAQRTKFKQTSNDSLAINNKKKK